MDDLLCLISQLTGKENAKVLRPDRQNKYVANSAPISHIREAEGCVVRVGPTERPSLPAPRKKCC